MSRYLSDDYEIRWLYAASFVMSAFFCAILACIAVQNTSSYFAFDALMGLLVIVHVCYAAVFYRRGLHGRIRPTYQRIAKERSVRKTRQRVIRAVNRIITDPANYFNSVVAYEVKDNQGVEWMISWWGGDNTPSLARLETDDICKVYKTYMLGNEGMSIRVNSLENNAEMSIHEYVQKNVDFDSAGELTRATSLEIDELLHQLHELRGHTVTRVA